jgi:hypothetical protein
MSNWDLYKEASGGGWEAEDGLPRPQQDVTIGRVSNMQVIPLADGTMGFYTPETASSKPDLQFSWFVRDETFSDRIQNYIDNNDYIKIVTHTGKIYLGRFASVSPVWLVGREPDEFEVTAVFIRMTGSN